jgi:hypothetical protein
MAYRSVLSIACILFLQFCTIHAIIDTKDAWDVVKSVKQTVTIKCPKSVRKHMSGGGSFSMIYAADVLLHQGVWDKASACAVEAIDSNPRDSLSWNLLATILRSSGGATERSWTALYEEAMRLSGAVSSPRFYELLGPFSIGKGEVDGDPTEAPPMGGITKLARGSRRRKFPSEFAEGGYVQWKPLPSMGPTGMSTLVVRTQGQTKQKF